MELSTTDSKPSDLATWEVERTPEQRASFLDSRHSALAQVALTGAAEWDEVEDAELFAL